MIATITQTGTAIQVRLFAAFSDVPTSDSIRRPRDVGFRQEAPKRLPELPPIPRRRFPGRGGCLYRSRRDTRRRRHADRTLATETQAVRSVAVNLAAGRGPEARPSLQALLAEAAPDLPRDCGLGQNGEAARSQPNGRASNRSSTGRRAKRVRLRGGATATGLGMPGPGLRRCRK